MDNTDWNEEQDFNRQSQEWYELQEEKYRYDTVGQLSYVIMDIGVDEFMNLLKKNSPQTHKAFLDYFYPMQQVDFGVLLTKKDASSV